MNNQYLFPSNKIKSKYSIRYYFALVADYSWCVSEGLRVVDVQITGEETVTCEVTHVWH